MRYRINRKTGDKISEIGIGSSYMFEAGLEKAVKALEKAYEGGINYYDLAAGDGKSFSIYGEAFKGIRKNIYFQIYFGADYSRGSYGWSLDLETVKKSIDWQLRELHTDYIDYGFIHCQDEISDWMTYQENGISVMKPFSGGQLLDEAQSPFKRKLTIYQCIQYALDKPRVLTVLPGAQSVEEIEKLLEFYEQKEEKLDYSNKGGITMIRKEELKLVTEWDKTFKKSDKVDHSKVTFVNRYGITLAADMYVPKNADGKLPAIAVCGPFGAVKEQCSGLYAQNMAERGFLTIAFDPSFTGESGGNVRYMASPDINTEDFMAAVDFLLLNEKVDSDRIGILGICGWGGMAINTAALDTRIKATVASTMYDMTRVNAKGYFDSEDSEETRYEKKKAMCAQRLEDLRTGEYKLGGGVVDPLPADAPFFVKDYHDYYKTDRGYHERSLNSNGGWNVIGCESFLNQPILKYSNEIRSAVLLIHGEKAHSCYFSKDAYDDMIKDSKYTDNKELMIIPDAVHTDLYDGGDKNYIPFDKLENFFNEYLK